jgi:hypothetical protein
VGRNWLSQSRTVSDENGAGFRYLGRPFRPAQALESAHDGSVRRRQAVYGAAVGGVLLGHWLTYLTESPGGTDALLRQTGHAYLTPASEAGVVVALVALAVVFLGGLTGDAHESPPFGRLAARLVAFQLFGFVAMEVLERITSGAPLSGIVDLLAVGVAIQILVAMLVALLVGSLVRVADRTAARLCKANAGPLRPTIRAYPRKDALLRSRPVLLSVGVRGPPSSGS